MRIIAGSARGTTLLCPEGLGVRPTSDLVRGAVMSMLGGHFHGKRVLDVCAGTGAVALEWLSRGAELAVAIERDREALRCLRVNAKKCHLDEYLQVLELEALAGLERLAKSGAQFDLVYVDPPYASGLVGPILGALRKLLVPGGDVLVETGEGMAEVPQGWRLVDRRRHGSAVVERMELAD
jgi:16S rRNA (guanine(966)-N(2))-methyltransferase RsmD